MKLNNLDTEMVVPKDKQKLFFHIPMDNLILSTNLKPVRFYDYSSKSKQNYDVFLNLAFQRSYLN